MLGRFFFKSKGILFVFFVLMKVVFIKNFIKFYSVSRCKYFFLEMRLGVWYR